MDKPAKTTFSIHPLLTKRWSPRAFSRQPVEREKLQRIFEAARWAPSASNEQPWSFIIGFEGDATFRLIFDTLVEFNQLWVKTAPMLVVAVGRKASSKSGKPNEYYRYDVGQALAHLTIQAASEDLFVHQMGGFDANKLSKSLFINDDHEPVSVFTIGYQGDYRELHPNHQKLELADRTRKSQEDFIFSGKFGLKFTI